MKYMFIINPMAGAKSCEDEVKYAVNSALSDTDTFYDLYVTKAPGDATEFVSEYAKAHSDTEICFVACGGDGTINEVASGLIGHKNAYLSVYPGGSGNDYVKYYGGREAFLDIRNIVQGTAEDVDVMKIGDKYSINICNFGFDTAVADTMSKIKRLPLLGGPRAYYVGIAKALFTSMNNECKVYADGELLNTSGKYLLCTLGNGSYVGGSFNCSPRSDNSDGLIELCLVSHISLLKFIKIVGSYKKGTYLDIPEYQQYLSYRRASSVRLEVPNDFKITIDGEVSPSNDITIDNIKHAIRFIVPKGAKATRTKAESDTLLSLA